MRASMSAKAEEALADEMSDGQFQEMLRAAETPEERAALDALLKDERQTVETARASVWRCAWAAA